MSGGIHQPRVKLGPILNAMVRAEDGLTVMELRRQPHWLTVMNELSEARDVSVRVRLAPKSHRLACSIGVVQGPPPVGLKHDGGGSLQGSPRFAVRVHRHDVSVDSAVGPPRPSFDRSSVTSEQWMILDRALSTRVRTNAPLRLVSSENDDPRAFSRRPHGRSRPRVFWRTMP